MAFNRRGPKLGDVVTLVRGTTYKGSLLGQPGPVLLGLASIQRHGGFRSDSLKTYGGECKEKLILKPGDLYVSLKDVTQSAELLGAIARVPDFIKSGRLTQDTVKLDFISNSYPRNLLYWSLRSPLYRSYCREHATGTTTLGLARDDFLAFGLAAHTEQAVRLVQLLDAIEERIQRLKETNTTLEAIARTIFKSWFVDFEPVHANAERREPKGENVEAAVMRSTKFNKPELGTIPMGWQASQLGDIVEVIDCLHARKPEIQIEGRPYLQLNCIRNDGLLQISAAAKISEVDYKKWTSRIEVQQGDCVITNVGRVGAIAQIPEGFKASMGRNMTALRVRSSFAFPTFLLELLQSDAMRAEIVQNTDAGTILNALNVKSIPGLRFIRPPTKLAQLFEHAVRPMRLAMENNLRRIDALSSTRDTLLPRLVVGTLRPPVADAAVERVTG